MDLALTEDLFSQRGVDGFDNLVFLLRSVLAVGRKCSLGARLLLSEIAEIVTRQYIEERQPLGGWLLATVDRQPMKDGVPSAGLWRVLHKSTNKVEEGVRLISEAAGHDGTTRGYTVIGLIQFT